MTETIRGGILDTAKSLTEGSRNEVYGDPVRNMECFAKMVEGYLYGLGWTGPEPLDCVDGSEIMSLSKKARVTANKKHADTYPDDCAYAAIAGECAAALFPGLGQEFKR